MPLSQRSSYQADIDRVLIDRAQIAGRLDDLAEQISEQLNREAEAGQAEVTLVPILTGSIIFVSDLIRRLPLRMQIRLISVTSYPGRSTHSRGASVEAALTKLPESLEGHHVLIIDDILDSGTTLRLVREILQAKNPDSLRSCVLLRKDRPEAHGTDVDYVAFDIPDEFVVGYGLDYDDYYRNLPDIVTLRREVYEGPSSADP